jgi:nitroreductase
MDLVDFPAALAEIPVAEWASAVSIRRSARTYKEQHVEQASLDALRDFCAGLPGRSVARVVVLDDAPQELFTGLVVGSYGRVAGASSAVVVIGRPAARAFQECMGYLGEAVLLQATTMGLGTCWIAGSFDRAVASRLVDLEEGEQVFAVSPLGYAQEKPRTGEMLMKALVRAKHRRSAAEIAPGFDEEHWPAWAAEGVRMARIAPSAVNRQPWRFVLDQGAVTVSVVRRGAEGSVSRLLDVGIAMLHFEVGARLMGASGAWEVLVAPDVALFRPSPR